MTKLALLGAAVLALAASPALGQAGGGAAPGGGPPGGAGNPGGAAERLSPPDRDAGNAQEAIDRQGQFGRDFAPGSDRAQAYRTRLQEFGNQSAGRRAEAFALRDAALGGQPVLMSSQQIRDQLRQDMEDWRKTFRIGREEWQGLRDEILVETGALTPRQWADRRAQWFELRDAWIAQQLERTAAQGGEDTDG